MYLLCGYGYDRRSGPISDRVAEPEPDPGIGIGRPRLPRDRPFAMELCNVPLPLLMLVLLAPCVAIPAEECPRSEVCSELAVSAFRLSALELSVEGSALNARFVRRDDFVAGWVVPSTSFYLASGKVGGARTVGLAEGTDRL